MILLSLALFLSCKPAPTVVEPSLSLVTPHVVYTGRTVDVTVSGYSTAFSDDTAVDFGAGITVVEAHAASPTALRVTLEVDTDSALGVRDVVVDGLVYAMAFDVAPAVEIGEMTGTVAAGSIVFGSLALLDTTTPFDTTMEDQGPWGPPIFPNLAITSSNDPDSIYGTIDTATPFSLEYTMFLDVGAAGGPTDLIVASGSDLDTLSVAPGALDVQAREPVLLADGRTAITAPEAFGSQLYRIDPNAMLVSLSIDAEGGTPGFILVPESGRVADFFEFSDSVTFFASDPFYAIFWDNSGEGDYAADLVLERISATPSVNESEAHDVCGGADPADLPVLARGDLDTLFDEDWYGVTVGASDIGRRLHVVTLPGQPFTDTVVEVFADDCSTSIGGASDDIEYHEDHRTGPLTAAGTYWVRVSNSDFGYSDADYDLLVKLE